MSQPSIPPAWRADVVDAPTTEVDPSHPDEAWSHAQLDAWATERQIDLAGAKTKAEKLERIHAADVPEVAPEP